MTAIPSTLFQYRPASGRTLSNLQKRILYFGSPLAFNDPFDFALFPRVPEPSPVLAGATAASYFSKGSVDDWIHEYLGAANEWDEKIRQSIEDMIAASVRDSCNRVGVSCFTECCDNILMWSHYADNHKGICLEFSTGFAPFAKARKVQYSKSFPSIGLDEFVLNENFELVFQLLCTKAIDWEYEQEWRVVRSSVGESVYEQDMLKAVYLGVNADSNTIVNVMRSLKEADSTAVVYKGQRSRNGFEIEFSRLN